MSSSLIFLRARYFDPATGRFISKDPFPGYADSPQTLNAYSYVSNNSINLVDPGGYGPDDESCMAGGIGCGPDVTDWFEVELNYWQGRAQREMAPYRQSACQARNPEQTIGASIGLNFVYGGEFPYKVIDFNYADAPNREGTSPWPPMYNDSGKLLHGTRYKEALQRGAVVGGQQVEPYRLTWRVPGGGSVTLCGTCIERSELGNFMLGYFANFTLMSEEEIAAAAIMVGGSQRPWDEAALRFGHRYAGLGQSGSCCSGNSRQSTQATSTSLCSFLAQAGISAMVDADVQGYQPSSRKLYSGFGHYTQPRQWDEETWGPQRPVNDAYATPVTTCPGASSYLSCSRRTGRGGGYSVCRLRHTPPTCGFTDNNPLRNCQLDPGGCWPFPPLETRPMPE